MRRPYRYLIIFFSIIAFFFALSFVAYKYYTHTWTELITEGDYKGIKIGMTREGVFERLASLYPNATMFPVDGKGNPDRSKSFRLSSGYSEELDAYPVLYLETYEIPDGVITAYFQGEHLEKVTVWKHRFQ
jgi:hypothetical protein